MKAAITKADKATWLAGLKNYLRECRTSPFANASSNAFYIVLGMISAADLLGALSDEESGHLRALSLNASNYRSQELLDGQPPYSLVTTQEQSA